MVDPGPDLPAHVDALLAALDGETITHLLVTHTHRDHSPACRPVQAATGARTYGFGKHGSGRIDAGMQVEEGADNDFVPDVLLTVTVHPNGATHVRLKGATGTGDFRLQTRGIISRF